MACLLSADGAPDAAAGAVRYLWVEEAKLSSQPGGDPNESMRRLALGEKVTAESCAEGHCAVTVTGSNERGWLPEVYLGSTPPTEAQLGARAVELLERACASDPTDACLRALEAAYRSVGKRKQAAELGERRKAQSLEEAARHRVRFARVGGVYGRPSLRDGEQVLALCPEGPKRLPVRVKDHGLMAGFMVSVPCKKSPSPEAPLPVYAIAGLPKTNARVGTVAHVAYEGRGTWVGRLEGQELRAEAPPLLQHSLWLRDTVHGHRLQLGVAQNAQVNFAGDLDGDGLLDVIVSLAKTACASQEAVLLLSSKSPASPLPSIAARAEEPLECE